MEAELWQEPEGLRAPLTGNTVIGRSPEADISVSNTRVSREHCMVRQQASGFWLYDLNSTNGTLLNDREIVHPAQLKHGDIISIADITFRFQVPSEAAGSADATASRMRRSSVAASVGGNAFSSPKISIARSKPVPKSAVRMSSSRYSLGPF